MKRQTWDTIVIGSGAGGLAAAVACARAGQRVLVLEARESPGGALRSMCVDGQRVSPGLQYVGGLGPRGDLRRSLEGLGVTQDGRLSFCELARDGFEHLSIGGERFDVPAGVDRFVERLADRFPHERDNLRAYFVTLQRIQEELDAFGDHLGLAAMMALPFKAPNLFRWGFRTQSALLEHYIRDLDLRDFLSATNGVHGLAPSKVALPVHAGAVAHFADGGFYPRGGAKAIAMAMIQTLRRRGGQLRLRAVVKRVLVERGRAAGVELANGERVYARSILSNAGRRATFDLLPILRGKRERLFERAPAPAPTAYGLFATVDLDLEDRGYDSGNYWFYRERDVGAFYRRAEHELPSARVDGLFLSITSLKDPERALGGRHTIEMFTLGPRAPLDRHGDKLGDAMLAAAEKIVPGLGEHLVARSAVTPFAGAFGARRTPFRLPSLALRGAKTSIEGLYLCGSYGAAHGVSGAIKSGLLAAQGALGVNRALDLLGPADGSLRIVPADRPETWMKRAMERVPDSNAANDAGAFDDVA